MKSKVERSEKMVYWSKPLRTKENETVRVVGDLNYGVYKTKVVVKVKDGIDIGNTWVCNEDGKGTLGGPDVYNYIIKREVTVWAVVGKFTGRLVHISTYELDCKLYDRNEFLVIPLTGEYEVYYNE